MTQLLNGCLWLLYGRVPEAQGRTHPAGTLTQTREGADRGGKNSPDQGPKTHTRTHARRMVLESHPCEAVQLCAILPLLGPFPMQIKPVFCFRWDYTRLIFVRLKIQAISGGSAPDLLQELATIPEKKENAQLPQVEFLTSQWNVSLKCKVLGK